MQILLIFNLLFAVNVAAMIYGKTAPLQEPDTVTGSILSAWCNGILAATVRPRFIWLKKTLNDDYEYHQYQNQPGDNILYPVVFEENYDDIARADYVNTPISSIRQIYCEKEVFNDYLISGFAAMLAVYAKEIGYFDAFSTYLNVDIKEVDFTVLGKIEVIIIATCMGCDHTKDINFELRPYPALPNILDMPRIPEQSQISRFYSKLSMNNYLELVYVMDDLFSSYCMPVFENYPVDIDIDTTGIVVYGDTYECKKKGYFSHQQGKEGYQLTAAITNSACNFVIANILDPGNVSPGSRFFDILYSAAESLGSLDRIGLIRADRAQGTGENVQELIELGMEFLIKAINGKTALKYIESIGYGNISWTEVTDIVKVADIGMQAVPSCCHKTRVILIETITFNKKKKEYVKKYTNLYVRIKREMNDAEIFNLYGERQIIESVFDTSKNGLAIDVLKCRKFAGLSSSIILTFISYNLLCLFRKDVLSGLGLENLGIKEIIKRLMNIPAKVKREGNILKLGFPDNHPYTKGFKSTTDVG
jgi:hypothetical protein